MAQIIITIPDAVLPRVINALCSNHDYTADKGTKAAFAKKVVIEFVMQEVQQFEAASAAETARAAAHDKVIKDITLT